MIDPYYFLEQIKSHGIEFITGVPDSLLKEFNTAIVEKFPIDKHIIAANEGNAVAMAAGHFIATNKPALVYMQNSGFGNAINPIVSLADKAVYGIPMLLMIGWRGEPGKTDEPQHLKQGQITEALLNILEIPTFKIDSSTNLDMALIQAFERIKIVSAPVALLVSLNTFKSAAPIESKNYSDLMTREEAIGEILKTLPSNAIVVSTTGMASREVFEIREKRSEGHNGDFLTVGSMGHASSIALMIAKNLDNKLIVCIDGDGSVIMHMGSLGVIGQSGSKNLLHILLNNGAHDSVGGQPTVGLQLDFKQITISCGYRNSECTDNPSSLRKEIQKLVKISGPNFIEVKIRKGSRKNLGRPTITPKDNLRNFIRSINNVPK